MPRDTIVWNDRARAVYNGFLQAGFNRTAALYLTGRAYQESNFHAGGDRTPNNRGILNVSDAVYRQMIASGINPNDIEAQARYLGEYFARTQPDQFNRMQNSSDISEAGHIFREGGGDKWGGGNADNKDVLYAGDFENQSGGRSLASNEWQSTAGDRRFLPEQLPEVDPSVASSNYYRQDAQPDLQPVSYEEPPKAQPSSVPSQQEILDQTYSATNPSPFIDFGNFPSFEQSNLPAATPSNLPGGSPFMTFPDFSNTYPDAPTQVNTGITYSGDPVTSNLGESGQQTGPEAPLINPVTGETFATETPNINPMTGQPFQAPAYNPINTSTSRGTIASNTGQMPWAGAYFPPTTDISTGTVTEHNANLGSSANVVYGVGQNTGQHYYNVGNGWVLVPSSGSTYRDPTGHVGGLNDPNIASPSGPSYGGTHFHDIVDMMGGQGNLAGDPTNLQGDKSYGTGDAGVNIFTGPGGAARLNAEGGFETASGPFNSSSNPFGMPQDVLVGTAPQATNNDWINATEQAWLAAHGVTEAQQRRVPWTLPPAATGGG